MSHEIDMSNNRPNMAYVGEVPWHGLGFSIDPDASIEEWKVAAGLDWKVVPEELYVKRAGQGSAKTKYQTVPNRVGLFRSDTDVCLCVTSDKYEPVQPGQVLEFFRDLTQKYGGFRLETAGSLRGGRKIWGLAKAEDTLSLDKADVTERYLLMATSYDMSLPTIVQQTSVRVVCANTLGFAFDQSSIKGGRERAIRVRHSSMWNPAKIHTRLALDEQWEIYQNVAKKMAEKKLDEEQVSDYFKNVFYPEKVRQSKDFSEKGAQRRVNTLLEVYYTGPGQRLATAEGTVWGALHAVTRYIDHECRSRDNDIRLDKAWFGDGAAIKTRALEEAVALIN